MKVFFCVFLALYYLHFLLETVAFWSRGMSIQSIINNNELTFKHSRHTNTQQQKNNKDISSYF
ncbi:hypothetical protein ACF0H5_010570 [Mactra antiquata]